MLMPRRPNGVWSLVNSGVLVDIMNELRHLILLLLRLPLALVPSIQPQSCGERTDGLSD